MTLPYQSYVHIQANALLLKQVRELDDYCGTQLLRPLANNCWAPALMYALYL